MSEWQRLTPEDDPLGSRYCAVTSLYNGDWLLAVARIKEGKLEPRNNKHAFCLSPAELLALVRITGAWRDVPEVRALVEVGQQIREQCLGFLGYDATPNLIHLIEQVLDDALAPFEDSADG